VRDSGFVPCALLADQLAMMGHSLPCRLLGMSTQAVYKRDEMSLDSTEQPLIQARSYQTLQEPVTNANLDDLMLVYNN
jgi:hypothetical protein